MKKNFTVVLFIFFFFFVYQNVFADFDITKWQYKKKITPSVASGFVAFNLDKEILSHSNEALSDVRLTDNKGEEIPYVYIVNKNTETSEYISARMFDKSFVPAEYTIFSLDLGKSGLLHNKLGINTDSENYKRNVQVEGSNDGKTWSFLTQRGQIFDYTLRDVKYAKISDNFVRYPESTVRYLRVKILGMGEGQINVSGASVLRDVKTEMGNMIIRPSIKTEENLKERTTDIIADIGSSGITTSRVEFDIDGENYNRRVGVFTSSDLLSWQSLGDGYVFRINTDKFIGQQYSVSYRETKKQYIKFVIYNLDDKPVIVKSVNLYAKIDKIAFEATLGEDYYIYYGSLKARHPQYDIEKMFSYVDEGKIKDATVGEEEVNGEFVPILPPFTERHTNLLPLSLLIIVAVFGFILVRLFTKKLR